METDVQETRPNGESSRHGHNLPDSLSKVADPPLDDLGRLMERLETSPYNFDLRLEHIAAAKKLSKLSEQGRVALEEAREAFAAHYTLPEELYLDWCSDAESESPERAREIYERAISQWPVSVVIWTRYLNYVVAQASQYSDKNERLLPLFSRADEAIGYHLAESQKVWQIKLDWLTAELSHSAMATKDLVEAVYDTLRRRIQVPHLQIDETWELFSKFVGAHKSSDYENIMASHSKLKAAATKIISGRIAQEDMLNKTGYSLDAYMAYLDWEESRTHLFNLTLTRTLYERALQQFQFDQSLWQRYLDFATKHLDNPKFLDGLMTRALTSCPWSGEVLAEVISHFGHQGNIDLAREIHEKALESGLVAKSLEGLIALSLAQASLEKSLVDLDDPSADEWRAPAEILINAFKIIKVNKLGRDPLFRMNRFIAYLYDRAGQYELALQQWDLIVKQNRHSHQAIIGASDFMRRYDLVEKARDLLTTGAMDRDCDWPEQVMLSLEQLEYELGTLKTQATARALVRRQTKILARYRARQAQEQGAYVQAATTMDAGMPDQALASSSAVQNGSSSKRALEDDLEASSERAAELNGVSTNAKRARDGQSTDFGLKRDREHSTVYVKPLSPTMTEEFIQNLFSDCGPIREIKQFEAQGVPSALVEFVDRADVPAALTKDKKRFGDLELNVYLAWSLTLYVTNFPAEIDDEAIRRTFARFGQIVETRWPSKRYQDSRRFCYVMYSRPEESQAALILDQDSKEFGQGLKLQVAISDPSRRVMRSDANAAAKEIYLANLSFKATELDVSQEFVKAGTTPKQIRLQRTTDGRSRGFAFIDFETEQMARDALKLDGSLFMGRRLSVKPIDHDRKSTHETRHGSDRMMTDVDSPNPDKPLNRAARRAAQRETMVRLRKVPTDAQEALLQQALEKKFGATTVKQVLYTLGDNDATVEFVDKKDAGRACVAGSFEYGPDKRTILVIPMASQAINPGPKTSVGFVPRSAAIKSAKKERGTEASSDGMHD